MPGGRYSSWKVILINKIRNKEGHLFKQKIEVKIILK